MFWLNYESIWCDMVRQKGSLPAKTAVGWPLDLLEWCFTTQVCLTLWWKILFIAKKKKKKLGEGWWGYEIFMVLRKYYVDFPGGVYFGISLRQSRKKPCGIFRGLGF